MFFYAAREEEAALLLKAGMARPQRNGKKIRCLRLECSRKQAHTFLRRGRTWGQASKTFRVERVGDKRLRVFQHVAEHCLEFRPEVKVMTAPEPKPDGVFRSVRKTQDAAPVEPEAGKGVAIVDTLGEPAV